MISYQYNWFSRRREFRADQGGATYAGRENMIAALEALKGGSAELPDGMAASGIGGKTMSALFSTHPPSKPESPPSKSTDSSPGRAGGYGKVVATMICSALSTAICGL